ncbi:MAG TPA: GNAT family N-acetyltransferase [Baekduia sp.]|uniref:GNAT family N-acetyltransferase n=1 Tax=Baekduia sp. TaxID=2600305 RepID=UPI002D771339|nr:GNAT family N-acetyltransferase [Baekduia sp.]HET6508176.1 GNAT family N-acetyltransferase [Baekduia sp.]
MSETTVRLPDGTPVLIRPLTSEDGAELRRGLEHLSPRSAYRRFLGTPPSPTSATVRYLTDVDHVNHEALGASDPASGHGIAVARFVRDHADPSRAELAIAIADAWQRRGLGTLLLDALATRARAVGITTLTGLVLADNTGMLKLFDHLGPTRRQPAGAGTVEVEADLKA